MSVKQVIIIRKDLKMRRGKEIAQGAHVAMKFICDKLRDLMHNVVCPANFLSSVEKEWIEGDFTKVVLQVNSERELLDIYNELKNKFTCNLIQDKGLTEFDGVPTYTALAVGPYYSSMLDNYLGPEGKYKLKLY